MGMGNFINWLNENGGLIQSVEMVVVLVLGIVSLFLRRREVNKKRE